MSEDQAKDNALLRLLRPKGSADGSISTSVLTYISAGMWVTFAAVAGIVFTGWEQLSTAFITNIPLNGLIVFVALTGLTRSILSNVKCWGTARYLHAIDRVVQAPETPTHAHVEHFKRGLKRQGSVLNTKQFADLLENLPQYGHLNITDNDARMVKSKVGFRVSMMRNNTGFLAGLLVMLGLLGTFWGLLATIDSVGKAMGGMSQIGGTDAADMSGFLSSIAAPLEGMGLAFSSSLFGLSGSLLISFVNFLCGGVHNTFIESTSRWIDERIPRPTAAMNKGKNNPKVAGSDELKAWLVGFVQASIETNRQIAQLVETVREATDTSLSAARNTRNILSGQRAMDDELKELRRAHARGLHTVRKEVNDRAFELSARLRRLATDKDSAPATDEEQPEHIVRRLAAEADETPVTAPAEARDQISNLVDQLQVLLEQQDVYTSLGKRADENLEGLPPSLKDDHDERPDA